MSYLIPAAYSGMSSRDAHLRRRPPSGEPGTDYYMPIGTPLRAPTRCRVVATGGGVVPATGRFLTIDDGTRWIRFLHMKSFAARAGDELDPGEIFGESGASGYGSEFFGAASMATFPWANTGGPHVHVTAFRGRAYTFGAAGTVDFHALTGGAVAGGGSNQGDSDMALSEADKAWFRECLRQERDSDQGRLANIHTRIDQTFEQAASTYVRVRGFDPNADMLQLILAAANKAAGDEAPVVPFTAADVARELAPLLSAVAPEMSDAELERVAKALADEQARRLAE